MTVVLMINDILEEFGSNDVLSIGCLLICLIVQLIILFIVI